jgi:hypothetical protein
LVDPGHYECRLCTCNPTDQYSCFDFKRVVPEPNATPLQLADPKLDCAERRRRIGAVALNGTVHSRQEMGWLRDAARVAKLVADGNTDLAPVFWIRLYGIVREVYERLFESHAFRAQIGALPNPDIVEFLAATEKVAALFSDDERLYIQYRRDVECHPLQNAYEFKVGKKGQAIETFRHTFLAKQVSVTLADFDAAVGRVLASAPNEVELAKSFAARCWLELTGLMRKGEKIYG